MPELPEVEITRRHLEAAMVGRVLTSVRITHPRTARRNASPEEVEARLTGRRVESVGRRGKFLVLGLDDGFTMVAHLGMSGRFTVNRPDDEVVPHTHFCAVLDDGVEIRFVDPRTFGFIAVHDEDEIAESSLSHLGRDALSSPPDAAALAAALAGRRAPIKAVLLDQRPIAGMGNIYADEALHRAGIHPLTPGRELGESQVVALLEAVATVVGDAINNGGTTLADLAYLLPDGRAGENLGRLAVYGRADEPCFTCGTPIRREVLRGRSTNFCPTCQPR